MKLFFLLFLLAPLLEIYILIAVGGAVGAGATILLVIGTAALGAVLVRAQGFATLARMRGQLAAGRSPAIEVMEGVLLFVAGALLLTPGFVTDAGGFILLVPGARRKLIESLLLRRVVGGMAERVVIRRDGGRVIDAD